jgi:hypothetical protein
MNPGMNLDLNKVGIWSWIIFAGIGIIIFSIIYNSEYVFLGFITMIYGAVSFLLDLSLDRIISITLRENLTIEKMHSIPWYWHIVRLLIYFTPLIIYVIITCSWYKYF